MFKASIIIPVFNRQELIKDTLNSILSQTYQNWECIVVDDGSTDDTWSVIKKYAQEDERIKVYQRDREPKGAPTCRNIGAELSKSEYLIFWDSDDILAPWCVEERVAFMDENPELDFGLFQLMNIYSNQEYGLRCYIGDVDYLEGFVTFENCWGTSAVIWRRNFYKSIGGWIESAKAWQDGEVHIRALLKKPKFDWGSHIPSGIIRHGIDDKSISTKEKDISSLVNLVDTFAIINPLLDPYYKKTFIKEVVSKIWYLAYPFSLHEKIALMNNAYKKSIVSKAQKREFVFVYRLHHIVKNIPFIKGVYYRIFIRPRVKNIKSKRINKFNDSIKHELLNRTNQVDIKNNYRQLVEQLNLLHTKERKE